MTSAYLNFFIAWVRINDTIPPTENEYIKENELNQYRHDPVSFSFIELIEEFVEKSPEVLSRIEELLYETEQSIEKLILDHNMNIVRLSKAIPKNLLDFYIQAYSAFFIHDQKPLLKKKETLKRILYIHKAKSQPDNREINESHIEFARTVPIERAVSEKINRSGFISCPFHNEKTWSCKIYKNRYHCFGCGADGDVIDYVMKTHNINFIQAIKFLQLK